MGIAEDLVARSDDLVVQRTNWEKVWGEIADLCSTTSEWFDDPRSVPNDMVQDGPRSAQRSKNIYDPTGMWCIDRLQAGIESLVTPQAQVWHEMVFDDFYGYQPSHEEKLWLERMNRFLFRLRSNPSTGFITTNQKCLRGAIGLGTAVMFVEELTGKSLPYRHRFLPLRENYLMSDEAGEINGNFRRFRLSARNAVRLFREKTPAKVQKAYEKDRTKNQEFNFLHAVLPREELGSRSNVPGLRGSAFGSYYVFVDEEELISDSGFYEFPFIIYHWDQSDNGPYAESAVMKTLADLKTLQVMGKTTLQAAQQMIKPPLAIPTEGIINRPNMNAGAINYGALTANGDLRVKPIITAQNPSFAEALIEARRKDVKESLYINLFQVLIQNPNQTATEAMIRSNEKGELLGPVGSKIQYSMSKMIEREVAILERKGIYRSGSPLEPPASMTSDKSFNVRFSSPLDRLRRMNELVGMQRTLEMAQPIAQAKPEVLDNFDFDSIIRITQEITGAPVAMLRSEDDRDQSRQQTQQLMQAQQALMMAKGVGDAAKGLVPMMGGEENAPNVIASLIQGGAASVEPEDGGGTAAGTSLQEALQRSGQ